MTAKEKRKQIIKILDYYGDEVVVGGKNLTEIIVLKFLNLINECEIDGIGKISSFFKNKQ